MKVMSKVDIVRRKQIEHVNSERQVSIMSKGNPFICEIYATYSDSRNIFFCTEYCPGGDLFGYLRECGRFSEPICVFYAAELVLCLEYLHTINVAYRDLKPENILIAKDGHIKLCDFGFSKIITDRTWTFCGTTEYLAPEIILGKGHDKSVDWWSLGILIFEMLAGYPPFYGFKPVEIYERIIDGVYTFPPIFSRNSKEIVRNFLNPSKSKRLGNRVGGVEEIKRQLFFEGVDWFALQRKEVEPPFLPLVESWERGGGGGGEGSARTNLGGASFGSNASDSTSRDYGGHSTSTDNWFSGSNCTSHESIGDGNDARRSEGGGSGSGSGKHWKSSKWDTGGDERCDDLFGSLFGDWTWISL
eukprot:TRINITY_DN3379_c0_g1_i2.p1 TRINITY_DN3379_c0_g1~~TRINITY_DN3379_c0_g1_i2.p1  ORF type:complete len:359 (-),score=68.09 TRINITY_DN3379_c0_g1_i2:277-1353(-)